MERQLRLAGEEDDSIWQSVRLVAGALFLIIAGLGLSALKFPFEDTNSPSVLTDESR